MHFTKMNGAGNDFILLDTIAEPLDVALAPQLARALCDRRRSLGADGLMLVLPSEKADYKMLFYNSDGSMGEMCGNGARCICRYGFERGYAGKTQKIETTAGIVTGWEITKTLYRIRLNTPTNIRLHQTAELDGKIITYSYLELGNPGIPHAVVEIENLAAADRKALLELGRKLRFYPEFAKGANVNFCEVIGDNTVLELTYERGVEDFTLACGTGTGSTVAALTLLGAVSGKSTEVRMDGGTLHVDAEADGAAIRNLYLTGPTMWVAEGTVVELPENI